MKHPRWRVASIELVDPSVLDDLEKGCDSIRDLLPNGHMIVDYEAVGSYARGQAQMHSDLDINLSVGAEENVTPSANLLRDNREAFQKGFRQMMVVARDLGVRIEFAFEHFAIKTLEFKQVYSLKERKFYNREMGRDYKDFYKKYQGQWYARRKAESNTYRKPVNGSEYVEDPWIDEVEHWAKIYGKHYQRMGDTIDTEWFKELGEHRNPRTN